MTFVTPIPVGTILRTNLLSRQVRFVVGLGYTPWIKKVRLHKIRLSWVRLGSIDLDLELDKIRLAYVRLG